MLESTSTRAVAEKQRQPAPVIERIVDRLCQLRLGEELADHCRQPHPERLHQRSGLGAASGQPLLGTAAADLRFDGMDRLQALDHLARERRLGRFEHLDEFASGMGETKSELDCAAVIAGERLVGSITVHLQNAGKVRQLSGELLGAPTSNERCGRQAQLGFNVTLQIAAPNVLAAEVHSHQRMDNAGFARFDQTANDSSICPTEAAANRVRVRMPIVNVGV